MKGRIRGLRPSFSYLLSVAYSISPRPQRAQPNSVLDFKLGVLLSRDETEVEWEDGQLLENRDFLLDRKNGVIRLLNGCFAGGVSNYRVTCAAGFATVAGDLEELCIEMAKKLMRNEGGVTNESLGTWSKSYDVKAANALIEATIALYRRY